jgi:hypothetical protein
MAYPKLGATRLPFAATNSAVPHDTRYARIRKLFADLLNLEIVRRVIQKFHETFAD